MKADRESNGERVATSPRNGPLSGIRILDLTHIMAGPSATQILADLGADVIKVELPSCGDDTRRWGPPFLKDKHGNETKESAYNLAVNRGKRSITIDLTHPEGQRLVADLAAQSDVLVETFRPGKMKTFNLSYDTLKASCPSLIYCSISGYGQTGPWRERRGYDFAMQALSGLMSVTGERDGRPGAGPEKIGVGLVDVTAGLYAVIAILAALQRRERTGEGDYIDVALLDTGVAMMANQNLNYFTTGVPPTRLGNAHPNIAPYQRFATKDGFLVLTIGNDTQFQRFCKSVDRPELAKGERFGGNPGRVRHRDELADIIASIMVTKKTDEWIKLLDSAEVPCGPVNTADKVFANEQVRARGLEIKIDHPLAGKISLVASPMRFQSSALDYCVPPPLLGQHTGEVLSEVLGKTDMDISELKSKGVI